MLLCVITRGRHSPTQSSVLRIETTVELGGGLHSLSAFYLVLCVCSSSVDVRHRWDN